MSHRYCIAEARPRLPRIVDQAEAGVEIQLTRRGKPVAAVAALETYLNDVVRASFPILPYDDVAATWHGHERARLEALGRQAPYVDGQIAAIAHASQLVVVTVNIRDFSRFTGLKVENWSKRRTRG